MIVIFGSNRGIQISLENKKKLSNFQQMFHFMYTLYREKWEIMIFHLQS